MRPLNNESIEVFLRSTGSWIWAVNPWSIKGKVEGSIYNLIYPALYYVCSWKSKIKNYTLCLERGHYMYEVMNTASACRGMCSNYIPKFKNQSPLAEVRLSLSPSHDIVVLDFKAAIARATARKCSDFGIHRMHMNCGRSLFIQPV